LPAQRQIVEALEIPGLTVISIDARSQINFLMGPLVSVKRSGSNLVPYQRSLLSFHLSSLVIVVFASG